MVERFRPFLHLTNSGRRKWAFLPSVLLGTRKTIFGRKYSLKMGEMPLGSFDHNLLETAENNVRAKFYGSRLKMAINRVQYIHNIMWRNSYLRVLKTSTCPCFMVLGLVMNNRLFYGNSPARIKLALLVCTSWPFLLTLGLLILDSNTTAVV